MGWPWGPCPQAWRGVGAGRPGKDIDEDLTGSIPQLSVGVDAPEQWLSQGLGRVGPQLPAGSGEGQHGSADSLLLGDPVGVGARSGCVLLTVSFSGTLWGGARSGCVLLTVSFSETLWGGARSGCVLLLAPTHHGPCTHSAERAQGSRVGPHGDALSSHSTPLRDRWVMSGSEGPLPAQGAHVGTASAFMDLSPQGAQKGWLGWGLGWSRVGT